MTYIRDPHHPFVWESDGVYNGKFMAKDCTLHNSAEEAIKHDATPATPAATPMAALQEREACIEDIQDALGNWGGPEREHYTQAMHRSIDAIQKRAKGLDLWGRPAAAQPQRESERMTIHKLADLLLRDMVCRNGCPKCTESACSELAGHCSCTCHATWTALDEAVHRERESEQPEQALREITAEEVLEIYRGIVWYAEEEYDLNVGWIEFARRINELIRYRPAALSPQTDSQETP